MNNLNDALAWGLIPLYLAANGATVGEVGLVAGVYPAVWGIGQIWTGHWSDRVGRKPLIVAGMLLQAAALAVLAGSDGSVPIAVATAVALGAGTALVYPTLIAAISDVVSPVARAPVVGVYRFWRDMGYVAGGLNRRDGRGRAGLLRRGRRRGRDHGGLRVLGGRGSPCIARRPLAGGGAAIGAARRPARVPGQSTSM